MGRDLERERERESTFLCLQGQKLLKKESDVGMLVTSKQSTETRCM